MPPSCEIMHRAIIDRGGARLRQSILNYRGSSWKRLISEVGGSASAVTCALIKVSPGKRRVLLLQRTGVKDQPHHSCGDADNTEPSSSPQRISQSTAGRNIQKTKLSFSDSQLHAWLLFAPLLVLWFHISKALHYDNSTGQCWEHEENLNIGGWIICISFCTG